MTKKITIITTRQNFKWISMQEVLPSLEKCWPEMAIAHSYEYRLINIDENPLRSIMSFLIQSDVIVIIAFNETIAKFMREVRVKMRLPIPFVFHLHGLATIALWPFHHFQIIQALNEGDSFIGTCEGDRRCLELVFEKCKFHRVPYPFYPLELGDQNAAMVFAYVGRLSDQKNIHILIEAYHLLLLEKPDAPSLLLYGAEDFLGSPNMGIKSSACLELIKKLIAEKQLDQKVILKGFMSREEIYSELGNNHIAVSASTHSDENFGMAIMRSLALKARAVLTHWGGHIHFKEEFKEKVITVPVSLEKGHPSVDADAFKEAMKEALQDKTLIDSFPLYFKSEEVAHKFHDILESTHFSEQILKVTPAALKLFEQKNKFTQAGDIQKIYESYSDPMALRFLAAYK